MFLQIKQLILLHLEELKRNAVVIVVFLKNYIFSFCHLSTSVITQSESFIKISSLTFKAVSISGNKVFIRLLIEIEFSRAATKAATRHWGSALQRKTDCSIKHDEMDTEMGMYFPNQFVVSVSLKLSFCRGMDSKSNRTKILKNSCAFVYSVPKEFNMSKFFSRFW